MRNEKVKACNTGCGSAGIGIELPRHELIYQESFDEWLS